MSETLRVKRKRQFILGTLLALLLAGGIGYSMYIPIYTYEHRTISGIPEPVQVSMDDIIAAAEEEEEGKGEEIEKTKTIRGNGFRAEMRYMATYDIKGLVAILDDYYTKRGATSFDKAIPRDLSLAWGLAAEKADRIEWGHTERVLNFTIKDSNLRSARHMVSNNHVIVEEGELRQKLKRVHRGDYIEMKGYLVEGVVDDGKGGERFSFRSSTSRTDHPDHTFDYRTSCEIIYLTDLEWLD